VVYISHLDSGAVAVVGDAGTESAETPETPEIDCLFLSLLKMVFTLVTYFPNPFFLGSGSPEPPGAEPEPLGADALMVANSPNLGQSVRYRCLNWAGDFQAYAEARPCGLARGTDSENREYWVLATSNPVHQPTSDKPSPVHARRALIESRGGESVGGRRRLNFSLPPPDQNAEPLQPSIKAEGQQPDRMAVPGRQ